MARKRGLSPDERELWSRVARSATPLHPTLKKAAPVQPVSSPATKPPSQRAEPFALQPFSVGQSSGSSLTYHGAISPTPAQRLADQPIRMDHKTHRRMRQGKLPVEGRLDLHGRTLAEAHPRLISFIAASHAAGKRLVLVITGKGRGDHGPLPTRPGALRHQVPLWLAQPPLAGIVQQVQAAHFRHGGEGAYYVYLRR